MAIRGEDLDEGLSEELSEKATNVSICFQCGGCSSYCPMSLKDGPQIRKLMRKSNLGLEAEISSDESFWHCLNCSICVNYCPRDLNPSLLVRYLRRELTDKITDEIQADKEMTNVFVCRELQEEFNIKKPDQEDINVIFVSCSSNVTPEIIFSCISEGVQSILVVGCDNDYDCSHGEGRYIGAGNAYLTLEFLEKAGLEGISINYKKIGSYSDLKSILSDIDAINKISLADEWLDACAGCEMALVGINEKLLDLLEKIEISYSPVLVDTKEIPKVDIGILTGGIGNEENIEFANKMRNKSDTLIALGTCATMGGIQGLRNLFSKEEVLEGVYGDGSETTNADVRLPEKEVPELVEKVSPVTDYVDVDYEIYGCPPESDLIYRALTDLIKGEEPSPPQNTVCEECPYDNSGIEIEKIDRLRISEDIDEDGPCILSQGILCMGGATIAGCGANCPEANIPCYGCSGTFPEASDQAGEIIRILSNEIDFEEEYPEIDLDRVNIDDMTGAFYMFSLASSLLKNKLGGHNVEDG